MSYIYRKIHCERFIMNKLFPFANITTSILILIVGFGYHWLGRIARLLNWQPATYKGLQKFDAPGNSETYQHAMAETDVAIGWIYGVVGFGLFLGSSWAFTLAWIPGIMLFYHGINYWFWTGDEKKAGHKVVTRPMRVEWFLINIITGILTILVAWNYH